MKTKKSFIFRYIYTWIIFWCLSLSALAQTTTYPVQVYTQLTPPYTPYAPAYYSGGVEKMRVTLINSDMQQPLLDVYLKMKITSSGFSMQTPPEVRTPSVTLQAGVPTILSMTDLEPYFRKENLTISGGQSQFYRTQMLPDNFYRFHFEVYEVNTNRLLSNIKVGFAQVMIAAGDPPVLNLPLKGSVVQESNIPNIMFTWTPRHMSSVAAAYGTEYEISLVEIYDKQTSAENAFRYSRILHSERTRATAFIYNSAHPVLQPGMRYAWRVQAVAKEEIEDANVFKNNGYSEIFWFDYKGNCPVVTTSGVITQGMEATVSWQPTQAIDYILEYRKKGSARWHKGNVSGASGALYSLQPGETYEYRIGSRCYANDLYDYSGIKAFAMPVRPERSPNCGIMPDDNIANRTSIAQLTPGLPVFAGDFPIFITEVNGSGTFSGTGYVGIPFTKLPRVTVTFNNIIVNSDHQLIGGFFETKYDIKNNNMLWDMDQTVTGGGGVSDIRTGEERAKYVVNYTINPNIKVKPLVDDRTPDEIKEDKPYHFTKNENGKYVIILTDVDNNEHKIEADKLPVTIADNGGEGEDSKTYQIDEQGNMTLVSSGSKIKLDPATSYKVGTEIVSVEFAEIEGVTQYAVDQYRDAYSQVTEYYQQYKAGDKEIAASAKFMLPGTSDKLAIKITASEVGFDPQKVHFVTLAGKEYEAIYMPDNKQWEITVVASDAGDGQELFVVYEETPGKYATIALLNIYTYEPLNIKVKLVPVNNNNQNIDLNKVKQIYNKVGITVDIDVAGNFDYPELKGRKLQVTGSGLFSTLTSDMKALESAYSTYLGDKYDGDTYYLFMLDEADAKEKQAPYGDMPRGKQFGYLFNGAGAETVAHELGHGVFNLEHPFARPAGQKSFPEDALTDNLMHYHDGTNLAKLQWNQTRALGMVIGLFERDKDGMWTTDGHFYTLLYVGLMLGLDDATAVELSKASEYPDTHVDSPKDMEESDTWARPELQQKYHALTGGYHGMEVAATVYALTKTHKSKDDLYFLMHRFGDCFAHFDFSYDKGGFTTVELTEYINAIDNYIKDKFNTDYVLPNYISGVKYVRDVSSNKINTTLTKEQVTKELIDLILNGIDGSSLGGYLYLYTVREELIKYFPNVPQRNYKMYGSKQIACSTDGHTIRSILSSISGSKNPDAIIDRKDAFLYYIRSLSSLLSIMYPNQTGAISRLELSRIVARFEKIITDASYAGMDSNTRFDGIFQYEYLKTRYKNSKDFRIIIPVKYAENRLAKLLVTVQRTDFLDDSHSIVKSTKEYIESIEPENKVKEVKAALITQNGIQYYVIDVKLNYR